MKRLEYTEPVTEIDSGTLYKIIQNEYPLLYQGMKTNGFGVMENYIKIKGLYFPQNLPKLSEKLRYIWNELDFICLPFDIGDRKIWGWMYDFLHASLYVEEGSPTEKVLKSRNYPYKIKHGLPEVDGKQVEHSQNFAIWIEETDDEEKRKFLEKKEEFVPVRLVELCPTEEEREQVVLTSEPKKSKVQRLSVKSRLKDIKNVLINIRPARKTYVIVTAVFGILISVVIALLFAILL